MSARWSDHNPRKPTLAGIPSRNLAELESCEQCCEIGISHERGSKTLADKPPVAPGARYATSFNLFYYQMLLHLAAPFFPPAIP